MDKNKIKSLLSVYFHADFFIFKSPVITRYVYAMKTFFFQMKLLTGMPFLLDVKGILGAPEGLWIRGVLCKALCCEIQTSNQDKLILK